MYRTRSYRRFQRNRAIVRKKKILRHWWLDFDTWYGERQIGKLAKGKIHCSCWMCSGSSKTYTDWAMCDKRKPQFYEDSVYY